LGRRWRGWEREKAQEMLICLLGIKFRDSSKFANIWDHTVCGTYSSVHVVILVALFTFAALLPIDGNIVAFTHLKWGCPNISQ
jgi:hypothetical protein